MITSDTREKGLETLIVAALTGQPVDSVPSDSEAHERRSPFVGAGYVQGNPKDYHRDHAVDLAKLLDFLIQHSAGSGKSNSIAWLAHQLIDLEQQGKPLFDSIIVVTDRKILDKQIRDTIKQFAQVAVTVHPCRVGEAFHLPEFPDPQTARAQGRGSFQGYPRID